MEDWSQYRSFSYYGHLWWSRWHVVWCFWITLQWHPWWAHVRGHHVPYMNNQWRSAIRKINSLWRRFVKERSDANYDLYKAQRNLFMSLPRKAIKKYFHNKGSQNPANFWKMYRPFLYSRNPGEANDILLKEDGIKLHKRQKRSCRAF